MTYHFSPELDILIRRNFNSARIELFNAWTDPKAVSNWWGPKEFSTSVTELNLTPGGKWRYVMYGPDGNEYPIVGVFSEIHPPHKIVTTDGWEEDPKKLTGLTVTAYFDEISTKQSELTLIISHKSPNDRIEHEKMGVVAGWNSSFDCLDEYLAESKS